jgi:peptide/nickel transport system permease protein
VVTRLAVLSLVVVFLVVLLGPLLTSYDPERIDFDQVFNPPSTQHPLGTDMLGRDVLSRLVHGARVSLGAGLVAAVLGTGLGLCLGAVAGYTGGRLDGLLMRLADLMLALPTFFLLIVVQSLVPPSLLAVALIIAVTRWMSLARLVRARFLSLKEQEFTLAARATGCSNARIVVRHLLPNTSALIAVAFSFAVADAILIESALSFLGLGLPPGRPSWGNMLSDAQAGIVTGAWWVAFFPGLMILLVTLAVNLLGDGLRT